MRLWPRGIVPAYPQSALAEYLRVIREHVIMPLERTSVSESCFATAMLVFGAVDGLGKLTHPSSNAGAGDRFKHLLPRLGPTYSALANELWLLRNSLAHNAMNVACFMSKANDAWGEHLEKYGSLIFIHTGRLLSDFKAALDKLEMEFKTNALLFQQAESRLDWGYIDPPGWRNGGIIATPPPGIDFVREK